jgi:small subunit ribosomal protein S8
MINDTIADLLTRLRNSQERGAATTEVLCSKQAKSCLEVLKREGFINGYTKNADGKTFTVGIKYFDSGVPVLGDIVRMSSPGCRRYASVEELPPVRNGLGIYILSTSKGVISDREARAQKVGGEVWARVG